MKKGGELKERRKERAREREERQTMEKEFRMRRGKKGSIEENYYKAMQKKSELLLTLFLTKS